MKCARGFAWVLLAVLALLATACATATYEPSPSGISLLEPDLGAGWQPDHQGRQSTSVSVFDALDVGR